METPVTSTELPSSEAPSIECRLIPARKLRMVFSFNKPIAAATAAVVAGPGYLDGNPIFSGNSVIVPLRLVKDMDTFQVGLTDIVANDGTILDAATARLSLLRGDVNADGVVSEADANLVAAAIGSPVNESTAIYDIDLSGMIDSTDVNKVNVVMGQSLP